MQGAFFDKVGGMDFQDPVLRRTLADNCLCCEHFNLEVLSQVFLKLS